MSRYPSQFSLRTLLAVLAVVAITLGAFAAPPTPVGGLLAIFVALTLPGLVIAGIVHGGRFGRAFWIGAALPAALGAFHVGQFLQHHFSIGSGRVSAMLELAGTFLRPQIALYSASALIAGAACAAITWLRGRETQ